MKCTVTHIFIGLVRRIPYKKGIKDTIALLNAVLMRVSIRIVFSITRKMKPSIWKRITNRITIFCYLLS